VYPFYISSDACVQLYENAWVCVQLYENAGAHHGEHPCFSTWLWHYERLDDRLSGNGVDESDPCKSCAFFPTA
jgi:hypothetical protein